MLKIYTTCAHSAVDYAAWELKKYLRMMMPRCGDVSVAYDPAATDGFRLGLASHFGIALETDTPEAGDVHEFDDRGGILLGIVHLGEHVETGIRHRNDAHVGVDGAEGIVRGLRARVGDCVEQGRFADVRQTHDTKFHSFSKLLIIPVFFGVRQMCLTPFCTSESFSN